MDNHPFARGIDELGSYPDKAKIDALGMIAEDSIGNPQQIQELCTILYQKLELVNMNKKLPILYLIDHISKKLGTEFHEGFSPKLVTSFVNAYRQVSYDYHIKKKSQPTLFGIC